MAHLPKRGVSWRFIKLVTSLPHTQFISAKKFGFQIRILPFSDYAFRFISVRMPDGIFGWKRWFKIFQIFPTYAVESVEIFQYFWFLIWKIVYCGIFHIERRLPLWLFTHAKLCFKQHFWCKFQISSTVQTDLHLDSFMFQAFGNLRGGLERLLWE